MDTVATESGINKDQEQQTCKRAAEDAARLATQVPRGDVMVLVAITFAGQGGSMMNAAGLFKHELLKIGTGIEVLAESTEEINGASVRSVACDRRDYVNALNFSMVKAAFGTHACARVTSVLKRRRGRVPVIVACERALRMVATVPEGGVDA